MSLHVSWRAVSSAATLLACACLARPAYPADRPITPGEGGSGDLERFTDDTHPVQVTGFAVGDYRYDQRANTNSFGAGKVALALFREASDRVWIFGQLTTSLAEDATPGQDVATETEIDNLLVQMTPGGGSGLSLGFGKFDDPLGFERDDEPLNLEATQSFNYQFGRPAKLVGAQGRWTPGPHTEALAWVANGWDSEVDPNRGKTVGGRIGVVPREGLCLGLGGLFGPEGDQGATNSRYLLTLDYAFQPCAGWLIAGEGNYGGDRGARTDGGDARWYGATVLVMHPIGARFNADLRAETFNDRDGARTGQAQTLQSYSIGPAYVLGTGREGIFANIEHTTIRIPRFQIRAEARLDGSTRPFFDGEAGPTSWNVTYAVQVVSTF